MNARRWLDRLRAAPAVALLGLLAPSPAGCVDETHELAVKALGPEDPNVQPGPLHRPGQPCVTCHGGSGPASKQFSVGGTVFATKGQDAPAPNATVTIEDITGVIESAQTNEAGNFYITVQQWQPSYPILPQVTLGTTTQTMSTHVARDGSCADCHTKPESSTSAGPVYVKTGP
jgi:hypothetical protein